MSGINNRRLFGRRKKAEAKERWISTLFIILWRMCTAGTVNEKVRINQFNVLCQPASNCILTQCNSLQTSGLDAWWQLKCYSGASLEKCLCAVIWYPLSQSCSSHSFALSHPLKLSLSHCAGVNVSKKRCWLASYGAECQARPCLCVHACIPDTWELSRSLTVCYLQELSVHYIYIYGGV